MGECPIIPDTLPRDLAERLTGELASPKFKFTPGEKIKVESKDDMRKRGIGSPDLADAYVMTFYLECGMPAQESEHERLRRLANRGQGGAKSWQKK